MKKVYEIIELLRTNNSSNFKKKVLEDNKSNTLLKKVLFYTYNPFYTYGVKKYNEIIDYNENLNNKILNPSDAMFEILDNLRERIITGNNAINLVESVIEFYPIEYKEIFKLILKKNLDSGISTSIINKVFNGLIPTFKIPLASGINAVENINFPAICQMKGDGRRTIVIVQNNEVTYFTRSGKIDEKLNIQKFNKEFIELTKNTLLKNNMVFDCEAIMIEPTGELVCRKESNGALNRKELETNLTDKVCFLIWDMVELDIFNKRYGEISYIERFEKLKLSYSISKIKLNHCQIIESVIVNNLQEAEEIASNYISQGYEGAVLKNMDSPYEGKRTNNMIKIKAEHEVDLRVIGWNEGTGIMKGYLGALICESECGNLNVSVGTGFSHSDRGMKFIDINLMLVEPIETELSVDKIIGKIITVKYNELIQNATGRYSLFLPRFIEIRYDKDVADDIDKIKEEKV